MLEALIAQLETIEDPRCAWKVEHRLLDILVIAVCAVLGEAEGFEDIALYGRCKREWLEGFLALPNGIPSHDTFRRVLTLVDPDAFERRFLAWVRAVFRPEEGAPRQIAVDGKTVRRSFDLRKGRSPLHLVSAYRGNARDQPAISAAMKASSQPAYLRLPLRLAFRVVSARARFSAIRRNSARFRPALRSRTRLSSSRKVTSSTQCSPFSIHQWLRMAAASASGGSAALER